MFACLFVFPFYHQQITDFCRQLIVFVRSPHGNVALEILSVIVVASQVSRFSGKNKNNESGSAASNALARATLLEKTLKEFFSKPTVISLLINQDFWAYVFDDQNLHLLSQGRFLRFFSRIPVRSLLTMSITLPDFAETPTSLLQISQMRARKRLQQLTGAVSKAVGKIRAGSEKIRSTRGRLLSRRRGEQEQTDEEDGEGPSQESLNNLNEEAGEQGRLTVIKTFVNMINRIVDLAFGEGASPLTSKL